MNTRKNYPFTINAWVLLPDNLHCILTLPENNKNFSVRRNGIKKRFTTAAKHKLHKPQCSDDERLEYLFKLYAEMIKVE